MKINYTMFALIAMIALVLGIMIGYYYMPEKVKITEKVVKTDCSDVIQLCKPTEIIKTVEIKTVCPVCEIPKSCNELQQIQQHGRKEELAETHKFPTAKVSKQIYAGPGQNL